MRAFLCRVSSLFFHCIDWCFVNGSHWKTHDSLPVMICPRCIGSASQSFKNISAMKPRSFFCSGIKTFKTSFEYTFVSKFCYRILCILVREISTLLETSLIVFRWAFSFSCFTFFNVVHVARSGQSTRLRASSPTNSHPLRKRPTHFFTPVLFFQHVRAVHTR